MNQIPSHSQTPTFDNNNNQTSSVLYQHPTAQEMRPSRRAIFIANAKDFAIFALIAIVCWLVISLLIAAMFGG